MANAMESGCITGRKVRNVLRSAGMGGEMSLNMNNDNVDVNTGLQDEA